MRLLDRNKRNFYYALYDDYGMLKNPDGSLTGERGPIYGSPVLFSGNITPAKGNAYVAVFGVMLDYDRVIQIEGETEIDEKSVLWLDDLDTKKPNDYKVVRKAVSLNHTTLAVKKVR